MKSKKLAVNLQGNLLSAPRNFFRLSELAAALGGSIYQGHLYERVVGLTTIWSAKKREVCVVSSTEDIKHITRDVQNVVTTRELAPKIGQGINIIIVSDLPRAERKMMNMFSDLTRKVLKY